MADPIINTLGIVGMKHCGAYDSSTNYEKLNVVTYQGNSYCAKSDTVGHVPTDTSYWDLLASKGDRGPEGPEGPQGPKPVKGVDYYTASDIAELESTLDSDVTAEVTEQLSELTSASPIAVSSTSDMTDTTRIYVNTTDGHWYWYDGDSWEDGGTYQSTGIANNSIYPYMTTFLETKNILPYTGWEEGKVYNNQGVEITYANGCLNREEKPVQANTKYIIINNNELIMSDITVNEYKSDDTFIKQTRVGYTLNQNFVTDAETAYVKFSSLVNKFSTLPVNSMLILSINDINKLTSYTSAFQFNNNNKQTIKSEDIFMENPYGFRLLPMIYRSNYNYNIDDLKFTSVYKYTNKLSITGATVIHGMYLYASNVTTDDYLYVDLTGSDDEPSNVSLSNGSAGLGYMTKIESFKYRIKLTNDLVSALNAGILRFQVIYANQTAGNTKNVKVSTYINYDFTNILNLINTDLDETPINFILLGDSITHLSGDRSWFGYFSELINANLIANVAVDGAHLKDYEDTEYDGNPSGSLQANNVLGNQVQKILNNNYAAPDVIMIAIGTNGGIEIAENDIKNSYLNGNLLKPLENVDRTTDAGAFRYCNETLHNKYPNAVIIWCCPIIANTLNKTTENVIKWGNNLKLLCDYGSNYCFDTANCGINMVNYAEYLADGLHPNAAGAKLMGYYNAGEFSKVEKRFK